MFFALMFAAFFSGGNQQHDTAPSAPPLDHLQEEIVVPSTPPQSTLPSGYETPQGIHSSQPYIPPAARRLQFPDIAESSYSQPQSQYDMAPHRAAPPTPYNSASHQLYHPSYYQSPTHAQPPVQTASSVPNITINFDNQMRAEHVSHQQAHSASHAQATNINSISQSMQQIWTDLDLRNRANTCKNFLLQHKWHIAGGSFVLAYCAICYTLHRGVKFLEKGTMWSSWKSNIELKDLMAQDMNKLGIQLIIDIQMRYSNETNPVDFISPLVDFNIQIRKEKAALEFYDKLYTLCKKWYFIKCIPFSTSSLESISEYILRAEYVLTVFKMWAAHHNLAAQTAYRV